MKIQTGIGKFELIPDDAWRERLGKYSGQVPFMLGGDEVGVVEMFGTFEGDVSGTIYLDPIHFDILKHLLTEGSISMSLSAKEGEKSHEV